jgi:hypothetical protein
LREGGSREVWGESLVRIDTLAWGPVAAYVGCQAGRTQAMGKSMGKAMGKRARTSLAIPDVMV